MEDIKIKSYKIETMDFEKHKKIRGAKVREQPSGQGIRKYMLNAQAPAPGHINGGKSS